MFSTGYFTIAGDPIRRRCTTSPYCALSYPRSAPRCKKSLGLHTTIGFQSKFRGAEFQSAQHALTAVTSQSSKRVLCGFVDWPEPQLRTSENVLLVQSLFTETLMQQISIVSRAQTRLSDRSKFESLSQPRFGL